MTDQVTTNRTDDTEERSFLFDDFDLISEIRESILKMGFLTPTPVQVRTFEKALKGEDLIAMAQTGTGKTAAFGIPMIQRLDPHRKSVQGLVLAPTRELALQVCKELEKIGEARGMKCAPVYGGASFTKQVSEVKDGAGIVVGTPGRVLDHIRRKTIDFSSIQILVLDEADEMLSMGFEKELSEIMESLPKKRQTMLFSATIPDDIRRLTKRYMGEAEIISVSGDAIGAKDVAHFVYLVSGKMRQQYIVKVIEEERPDSALIFCNTKEETQSLAQYLKKEGYNAEWLNSDLSQSDRERVMRLTRSGKVQFLVATDVAARGIDVSLISHVINYSFPESLEIYVHRTGRTGRAGRAGTAISLISPQDIGNLYMLRLTYKIFPVEKTLVDDDTARKLLDLGRLEALRKTVLAPADGEHMGLARRVLQDVRADRIVAGLLGRHFASDKGSWFTSVETEAEPKIEKQPVSKHREEEIAPQKPADRRGEPRPSDRKETVKLKKPSGEKTGDEPKETVTRPMNALEQSTPAVDRNQASPSERKVSPKEAEIYVDLGRKDGLRISDLMKEIMQRTGLPRTALGKVKMLTRSTFITVAQEHFQLVIKAVSSIKVDGKPLKAAPAEPR